MNLPINLGGFSHSTQNKHYDKTYQPYALAVYVDW